MNTLHTFTDYFVFGTLIFCLLFLLVLQIANWLNAISTDDDDDEDG